MRACTPAFLLPLLAAAAAHVACRSLADYQGELPRTATNQPDRLPSSNAVLSAADVLLGRVEVTLAGTKNVTDDNALRAAVLSGVASATDWLSVGDAAAIGVAAGASDDSTPTTSTPCGTTAPLVTYTIALVPAVLPTASQARQLIDDVAASVTDQLKRASLKHCRVHSASVHLDDKLYVSRAAPFPANATAGSGNVLVGSLRASGAGMSLCDVGLAALRTLQREDLVTTMDKIERSAANGTIAAVGARKPRRFHNLANTRFTCVLPQRPDVNPAYVTVDAELPPGGVDVMDIIIVIAGVPRDEAPGDLDAIRGSARLGRYTRELASTPGLTAASVGPAPGRDWLYNGATLERDGGIGSGALAAAIVVPSVAALALATGGGMYWVRRRRRARDRAARVAALAASGMCTTGSGSGKPSDLLRAIRDAAPSVRDPLARLANVEWEVDVADLQVATGDDGEEVELGSGASGRVVRGRYKKTGQDVAIKILTRRGDGGRGLEELAKEIVMLRACRHPNIVSFVGASIRDGVPPILVVELMPRGDLYRALDNPKWASVFTWQRVMEGGRPRPYTGMNRRIALDVARGLGYLHSRGIVHLDVKSVNVLLGAQMTAKLADAGAARALGDAAAATLTSPAGTLAWMAPEVFDGRASDKSDVYSLGIVLWELSTKETPKRPLRHLDDDEAPEAVRNIIDACLATDPAHRPTAAQVVAALEALDDDGQPVAAARSTSASLETTLAKVSRCD